MLPDQAIHGVPDARRHAAHDQKNWLFLPLKHVLKVFRFLQKLTDNAFRSSIVKTRVSECKRRYNTDTILDFPNPMKKAS